jgi:hypothetical protein
MSGAGAQYLLDVDVVAYTLGFAIWVLMNVAAFFIVFSRVGFRDAKAHTEQRRGARETLTARSGP